MITELLDIDAIDERRNCADENPDSLAAQRSSAEDVRRLVVEVETLRLAIKVARTAGYASAVNVLVELDRTFRWLVESGYNTIDPQNPCTVGTLVMLSDYLEAQAQAVAQTPGEAP